MKDQLEELVTLMVESGIIYEDAILEFEKKFISKTLERTNGNRSRAAKALGIHRNTLSRKIDDLRLDYRPKRHKPRHR